MDAYGLKVLKGRSFSEKFGSDSAAVIFNESAVHLLGFHKLEDALNKQIEFWGNTYTIVGVVTNHHQESLRQNYDSYIFRFIPQSDDYFSVKLNQEAGSVSDIVKIAENKWKTFFPGNPFDYFFLDDHFDKQYKADEQFGKTFALFAILAIIVACLGLFGLASFVTTQRTKEIGIRKISGAEVSSIVILLTRDFIKPVLLAIAIASPLTFFLFSKWLQNFAFKSPVSAWMFILPAMVILLIAILTVSLQTIKAASANPVKSLRTE
jgi:putative ABC transport system permease protein